MPVKRRPPAKKTKATRTGAFVLDGSVALAWFFEDELDAYAERVEDSLPRATIVVPSLWFLEVANALLAGERRKRTTGAKVARFLGLLAELPLVVDEQVSERAFGDVLALARAHGLSAYDAAYLELAVRRGLPLATLDGQLIAAAATAGVARYAP